MINSFSRKKILLVLALISSILISRQYNLYAQFPGDDTCTNKCSSGISTPIACKNPKTKDTGVCVVYDVFGSCSCSTPESPLKVPCENLSFLDKGAAQNGCPSLGICTIGSCTSNGRTIEVEFENPSRKVKAFVCDCK